MKLDFVSLPTKEIPPDVAWRGSAAARKSRVFVGSHAEPEARRLGARGGRGEGTGGPSATRRNPPFSAARRKRDTPDDARVHRLARRPYRAYRTDPFTSCMQREADDVGGGRRGVAPTTTTTSVDASGDMIGGGGRSGAVLPPAITMGR